MIGLFDSIANTVAIALYLIGMSEVRPFYPKEGGCGCGKGEGGENMM